MHLHAVGLYSARKPQTLRQRLCHAAVAFGSSQDSVKIGHNVHIQSTLKSWETNPPKDFKAVVQLAEQIFVQAPTVEDLKRIMKENLNVEVIDTSAGQWVAESLQKTSAKAAYFVPTSISFPGQEIPEANSLQDYPSEFKDCLETLDKSKKIGVLVNAKASPEDLQHELLHVLQWKAKLPFGTGQFTVDDKAQKAKLEFLKRVVSGTPPSAWFKMKAKWTYLKTGFQGSMAQAILSKLDIPLEQTVGSALREDLTRELEVHTFLATQAILPTVQEDHQRACAVYLHLNQYSYALDYQALKESV